MNPSDYHLQEKLLTWPPQCVRHVGGVERNAVSLAGVNPPHGEMQRLDGRIGGKYSKRSER